METALPGVITAVDGGGYVTVRPLIRKVETNGVPDLTNPEIPGVPLMRPGTGKVAVTLEPSAGDFVLLLFMSRDVTEWALGGGDADTDVTPECCGGNRLTDCVAVQLGRTSCDSDATGSIVFGSSGTCTINGHLEVSV